MKSTISLFAIVALLLQACGGGDSKSNPPPQVETGAITGAMTEQNVFSINQPNTAFDLSHTETEAVFETQSVPDTCYRSVQRGTKTECTTQNDRQCTTQNDNVCRDVQYPVCQNVPRNVCQNVPQQVCQTVNENVCRNVPQQVCQNVPRNVCTTVQQCTTQNDQVCRGTPPNQTCTNVPRRVCNPVQQCTTQNDSVCHTENRQVCENQPRQQCRIENRQQCTTQNDSVCHTETRRECTNVPRQVCNDVPRQVCQQVPNIVQEPYACTRDQQVQVGERTKLKITANVKVVVTNFGNINLSSGQFLAALNGTDVALSMAPGNAGVSFRLVKKDRTQQVISSVEKQIQVTFYIEVFLIN
jgi:hypothetical protein